MNTSASGRSLSLTVDGMSCVRCAEGLRRSLERSGKLQGVRVDFATARLVIDDAGRLDGAAVADLVRAAGFGARSAELEDEDEDDTGLSLRLALAVVLGMNLMVAAVLDHLGLAGFEAGTPAHRGLIWFEAVMATPAVLLGGAHIFRAGLRSVLARTPGMDALVGLGTATALLSSWVMLLTGGGDTYFDTAGMIVLFTLLGRAIEGAVRRDATQTVQALVRLDVPEAKRIDGMSSCIVPTSALRVGDRVLVEPGKRVPVDGKIVAGRSSLDVALLTGESAPRVVAEGDEIEAGATNLDGPLLFDVTRPVGRRELDAMRAAVLETLDQRPELRVLADRWAAWLTPLIVIAATVTGGLVWWGGASPDAALVRAVAVLVVACPCALGLATPMVLAVTVGRASRRGILFAGAEALDRASAMPTAIVFDKTGTLTEGRAAVCKVAVSPDERGWTSLDVLREAARAEHFANHPLARAILEAAPEVPVDGEATVVPGSGVVWTGTDGHRVLVGNAALLQSEGVSVPEKRTQGPSTEVAVDGCWVGTVFFVDPLRSGAAGVLEAAVARGLRVEVATGDTATSAEAMLADLGVGAVEVHASMRPLDKAALVRRRQAEGHRVAFVGDGVNDAAAMAQADVAIATDRSTDLASATADIQLRRGGAERVLEALELAQRARRGMVGNLAWASIYNVVAVPLAGIGLVGPAGAALLMAFSSLSVTLHALFVGRRVKETLEMAEG